MGEDIGEWVWHSELEAWEFHRKDRLVVTLSVEMLELLQSHLRLQDEALAKRLRRRDRPNGSSS